jgi:hypothetical protein
MLKNQRGSILFWVISGILAIALILVLAISGSFNLDPQKNMDDCTTNMKNIWVATNDYVLETKQDFNGDLNILRTTRKPTSKAYYLEDEKYCPESQGEKQEYIVFAKHVTELIDGETKHYSGILIFCPNLARFPKHLLDKTFYDNMSTSKLQNVMINDMSKIDLFTKSNGKLKNEYMMKYLDYWKNTKNTDFQACIDDPAYKAMRIEVTGETPMTEETAEEELL